MTKEEAALKYGGPKPTSLFEYSYTESALRDMEISAFMSGWDAHESELKSAIEFVMSKGMISSQREGFDHHDLAALEKLMEMVK